MGDGLPTLRALLFVLGRLGNQSIDLFLGQNIVRASTKYDIIHPRRNMSADKIRYPPLASALQALLPHLLALRSRYIQHLANLRERHWWLLELAICRHFAKDRAIKFGIRIWSRTYLSEFLVPGFLLVSTAPLFRELAETVQRYLSVNDLNHASTKVPRLS
jgi:hypothetical protein